MWKRPSILAGAAVAVLALLMVGLSASGIFKVKTKDDEKTILVGSKTKGLENAKEGSKVTIKYTEKDGQMRASEINPR